jgi:hypothetical protein
VIRNLIKLAIVLLAAHALYRFVPPYMHYHQFKDSMKETALFGKDKSDAEIVERIMALAVRHQIPIDRDAVQISRDKELTYVTIAYEEHIEWLPSYRRPMPFTIAVEGWRR